MAVALDRRACLCHRARVSTLELLDLASSADFEARRIINVVGPDATRFLQGVVSGDISGATRSATPAALLSVKGRLRAELVIVASSDASYRAIVPAEHCDSIVAQLDKFLIMDEVELSIDDAQSCVLVWSNAGSGGFDELRQLARLEEGGAAGLHGYEARHPAPGLLVLGESEALRGHFSTLEYCGFPTWTARRIATASPSWGHELALDRFPPELGFGYAVSYEKGCFLGQEPLARVKARGRVNHLLVRLHGDTAPLEPCTIDAKALPLFDLAGNEIGSCTSWDSPDRRAGTDSPFSALALAKRKSVALGSELRCPALTGNAPLVVASEALGEF